MRKTDKPEAVQTDAQDQGTQTAPAEDMSRWEAAANILAAACEDVRRKKAELMEEFQDLGKQREQFGKIPTDVPPDGAPFDRDGIMEATRETGTPVVERRWAALARAMNASVFQDETFRGALMTALDQVRLEAIPHDWDLQKAVNEAMEARENAIKAADAAVAKARNALAAYRKRFAKDFVEPVLQADRFGADAIPQEFRTPGGLRNVGLRYGAAEPVEAQISTMWSVLRTATQPRPKGDPYHHLLHHDGEAVPGLSRGVAVVNVAGRRSQVAGEDGRGRWTGPTTREIPRPRRRD